jgi:hypothetical protein
MRTLIYLIIFEQKRGIRWIPRLVISVLAALMAAPVAHPAAD